MKRSIVIVMLGGTNFLLNYLFIFFKDLTTYDTAKHFVLRNSGLKDSYITHALARFVKRGFLLKIHCKKS